MDLTGAGNTLNGGVSQVAALSPGTTYTVSFFVGNMDNRAGSCPSASAVQVIVNGSSAGTFSNNSNTDNHLNWQQSSFNFLADTASTTIEFRNATPFADRVAGLDDVFLDAVASSEAPEPERRA